MQEAWRHQHRQSDQSRAEGVAVRDDAGDAWSIINVAESQQAKDSKKGGAIRCNLQLKKARWVVEESSICTLKEISRRRLFGKCLDAPILLESNNEIKNDHECSRGIPFRTIRMS